MERSETDDSPNLAALSSLRRSPTCAHNKAGKRTLKITKAKYRLRGDSKRGERARPTRLEDGQERSVELVGARELGLLVVLALELVAD